MKNQLLLTACALTAAGLFTSAFGQGIQTAGTLQVNVDATAAPVGNYTYLTNSGALGGAFVVTNHLPNNNTGVSPQIIGVGGSSGVHGMLLDGNSFLRHLASETSTAQVLPPGSMTGANPVFSVEVWACKGTLHSEWAAVAWGTRTAGQNVSCNWGYNTSYGGFSWQGTGYDYGWAQVPTPGAWHHLVWTYDGAGTLKLYRDGVLDRTGTQTSALAVDGTYNILIGAQHAGTGVFGLFAGVIAKVRIHDGVLTDAQVTSNYAAEAPAFVIPTQPVLTSAPLHRYSFNLPATNNALGMTVPDTGSANGTAQQANALIQGSNVTAALPTFDGDQLILTSYGNGSYITNSYVDLPNGLLSSLSSSNGGSGQLTFELWVTYRAALNWCELLYFGNTSQGEVTGPGGSAHTGANGIIIPAQIGSNQDQSGVRGVGDRTIAARLIGLRRHIVLTWDELNNQIKLYHGGIQVGQHVASVKMNSIVDVNNWLGRSGWSSDANAQANYREFRIYNRVLNAAEVYRNYQVGPADASDVNTLTWNGNVDGNWDTATANWLAGATPANYTDGSNVQFGDSATGTTTVNLAGTVSPKSVLSFNSSKNYTIGGAGKISGVSGLTKQGPGNLTLNTANDYTGPNQVLGGKLITSSLANGGLPSGIGASSADPTSLVLSGGTLSYQGPATTIDRGYFITATNSTIEVQNSLTLGGRTLAANSGAFVKSGPGTLSYSLVGSNLLSGGTSPGYHVARGTVVFDGTAGTQINRNMTELWVGASTDYGANAVISNSTFLSDSWVAIGRGNGAVGNQSSLTLDNGTLTIAANGLSLGYNAGRTNLASQTLTLKGASKVYMPGYLYVGESLGSSASASLSDTSWIRTTRMLLGISAGATGAVTIANSAAITNTGYTSIGTGAGSATAIGGVGSMVVKDNAGFYSSGDFNVSDTAYSVGQLDIRDNATVTTGAGFVGKAAGTVGVLNMYGGSLVAAAANFQIGQYGQGAVRQSGGTITVGAWPSMGRYATGIGELTVSGGTFAQTNLASYLLVPEIGTATLTISGTGLVRLAGGLCMGNTAGASGTVNLDGGTLVTPRVWTPVPGAVSAYFYFNGGTLIVGPNANSDFMSGLSAAYVSPGGAKIDTAGSSVIIAQDLWDSGNGSLTKLGAGTLTLSGYCSYNGPTTVNAGTLGITTRCTGAGNITIADGAELSAQVVDFAGATVTPANLTAGTTTGAAITVGLGNLFGNPAAAPVNVSGGTLTANGTVTVSIDPSSTVSATGTIPLISYGALAGSGSFVLGTLPPGVFGYLTNDVSSSPKYIGVVVTSIKLPRWEGLAGGNWDIQVTTNWIDLATGLPEYFYQGSRALFNDEALGTTNVNLVTTVTPGGVVVSNSVLTYSIGGVGHIGGTAGLTKQGTGLLTVSTTNNPYTGMTLLDEGGTLTTTVPNNLGANSDLVLSNASTLRLATNNQKFASVTLANGTIAGSAIVTAARFNVDAGVVESPLAGGTLTAFGTNTDLVNLYGANTYTGRTVLAGSVLQVTNLANGGSPSGVGASSSDPTNLVFSGGTLSYAGPAAATDRGYSIANGGTFSVSGNLTLNGSVAAGAGAFYKSGPASLTYVRLGTNLLTTGGYYVGQGTTLLNGGAGTPGAYLQTNRITGELWVGYDQVNAGAVILTNTSLGVSSWVAVDRGNGTVGSGSRLTLYDSVLTSGNFSMGYAAGIPGNSSFPVLTLAGNSSFTIGARTFIGESPGADARVNVLGNSRLTLTSEWFALGNNGKGTMVLSNQAVVTLPADYNLGDVAGGDGTLYLYDNATNLAATLYVGKGENALGAVYQYGGYMGRSAGGGDWRIANTNTATGSYNLYGGIFEPVANFQIGAYGLGTWNQSGGVANCGSWPVVGRYVSGVGTMVVAGGIFNQTATGNYLIIAEEGTGFLIVSNAGAINCLGGLSIGHQATGNGTVNLDGGRLTTRIVLSPGAGGGSTSTLNFNGGVLAANANNTTFLTGLSSANVLAGGAVFDTTNYSITVAQPLLDGGTGGGLVKLGTGVLTLSGSNSYSGLTVVSNGALVVNGSIAGGAVVKTGAALGGNGVVNGVLTVEADGAVSAGTSIGALTLNSTPALNGIVLAEVNRNGGSPLADLITVSGSPISYAGTLAITNIGAELQVNDTFKLFNASSYSGAFTLLSLTPGQNISWDTSGLNVNGTVRVAAIAPIIPTTPTNIFVSATTTNVSLWWPTNYTGWRLEAQTNAISVGISHNWATVPGSTATNQVVFPIDPANGSVFYRLVYP